MTTNPLLKKQPLPDFKNIRTLEVLNGKMPTRALSLILEWASLNREKLLEDWELCQQNQPLRKIPPLK